VLRDAQVTLTETQAYLHDPTPPGLRDFPLTRASEPPSEEPSEIQDHLWAHAMEEARRNAALPRISSLPPEGARSPSEEPPPGDAALDAMLTPWDEGPAETPAITLLEAEEWQDPVASKTPMPVLDRAPVFQPGAWESGDFWVPPPLEIRRRPGSKPSPPAQPAQGSAEALYREARRKLDSRDLDGALACLERIPSDYANFDDAKRLLELTRGQLQQHYETRLGSFGTAPRITVSNEELVSLRLNHRAGYILSQIDGRVSLEDLIALSGMPRLDTLRILCALIDEKIIG
jgi:hypothetical protein